MTQIPGQPCEFQVGGAVSTPLPRSVLVASPLASLSVLAVPRCGSQPAEPEECEGSLGGSFIKC
jgi:hypothetical protein